MNAFKSVQDAIKGHYCCDIAQKSSQSLMDCENCPYNDDNDNKFGYFCVSRLNSDIQYYLKDEAERIKEEDEKLQPVLPGIFDDPAEKIADKLKEMANEAEERNKQDFHKKKWDKK